MNLPVLPVGALGVGAALAAVCMGLPANSAAKAAPTQAPKKARTKVLTMKYRLSIALVAASALLMSGSVFAQTTRPSSPAVSGPGASTGELAVRAQQAFNRGEYATALPMFNKLAADAQGDTTKLGPIQERIRVCQRALDALKNNPAAAAAAAAATRPAEAQTAEARKPHPAPKSGEVLEMAIKDLGNFEYNQETGGNIPADVKGLNGSTIRLRGYMIPMDQAENITQFALVPSLFSCCFGQPPQIQHTVVVNCPKGKAVTYFPDEIQVEGKLAVQEKKDDGYVVSLFEVEAGSVKAAPK